jgi:high-affinity nickel-transport protein
MPIRNGTIRNRMVLSILSLLALGFVLGLKHALDADHLAAISTMATERRSLVASSLVGAMWGLGHTVSLMIAGVLVLIFHFQISERTSKLFGVCCRSHAGLAWHQRVAQTNSRRADSHACARARRILACASTPS